MSIWDAQNKFFMAHRPIESTMKSLHHIRFVFNQFLLIWWACACVRFLSQDYHFVLFSAILIVCFEHFYIWAEPYRLKLCHIDIYMRW